MRHTNYIWGTPSPVPDQCIASHTYGGGCRFNADDPHRPLFPEELRPGIRRRADGNAEAA